METSTVLLIIVCLFLLIYSIVLTIGILRALKKTEIYESFIIDVKNKVEDTYEKMKSIDEIGVFEADDEVGLIFNDLKDLLRNLEKYINQSIGEEK